MQDIKIPGKNVPASMAIAQIVQAAATWFALGYFLKVVGFKNTLILGAGCWLVMYIIYVSIGSRWPVVASQSLHGLAYVFFIIVGQIFVDAVARPEIRSSMQAVIFFATVGVGMFLGTQFAGVVMDKFSVDGRFQWRKIWLVPMIVVLIGVVLLATLFHYTPPAV
jgi:MFS family permease